MLYEIKGTGRLGSLDSSRKCYFRICLRNFNILNRRSIDHEKVFVSKKNNSSEIVTFMYAIVFSWRDRLVASFCSTVYSNIGHRLSNVEMKRLTAAGIVAIVQLSTTRTALP